tara:strand:+ start:4486 stop:5187 length:702 start_codon:yes stop_codon:yes gene_type:complete
LNLIIEYFQSKNHIRNGEYLYCLHENIGIDEINNIYIFVEEGSDLNFDSPKIKKIVTKERPTYQDLFEYCNEHMKDEICIVANADIIFDDTLRYFESLNMEKQFYGLSRWEISTNDGKNWEIEPYDNAASQDVWIFKTPVLTSDDMNYTMGKPGCDNKIFYHMRELGYTCRNPGKKVITIHFHISNFRTYDWKSDRVPGPYLLVAPVDNFTGTPVYYDIDGFDEDGKPYKNTK